MAPEDFDRTLRAFQRRTPFRSYTVALVNGDRIQVDHPEALVVRSGVAVFIAADGTPTIFDYESVGEFIGAELPQANTRIRPIAARPGYDSSPALRAARWQVVISDQHDATPRKPRITKRTQAGRRRPSGT